MGYDLRFIKNVLYSLKRDYGLPVNIVWRTSSTANLRTGKKDVIQDSIQVNRGIVLPSTINQDFAYDLSFIASNKNFTYGGLFDEQHRRVIIDRADLPPDFEIKRGYYLVFNQKRYEVEQINEFENGAGYMVLAKQVTNITLDNYIKRYMFSLLSLDQTVEVTVD